MEALRFWKPVSYDLAGSSPADPTNFLRSRGPNGLGCTPVTGDGAGSSPVDSAKFYRSLTLTNCGGMTGAKRSKE